MRTLTEKYRAVLQESFTKAQFVRDARLAHPTLITQFNGFDDTVQILKNKGMISEAKDWMMGKDYPGYGQVVSIEKEDEFVHVTFDLNGEETTFTFVEDPGDRDKWIEVSETVNEELSKYKEEKLPNQEYTGNPVDRFSLETVQRGVDYELESKGFNTVDNDFTTEDLEKVKQKVIKNLEKDPNHYLKLLAGENRKTKRHDTMQKVEKNNHKDTFNAMQKAQLKEMIKKLVVKTLNEGV